MDIAVGVDAGPKGNIRQLSAYWVTADTFVWNIQAVEGNKYFFHYNPTGGALSLSADGVSGGETVPLVVNADGLPSDLQTKFPHLTNFAVFKVANGETRFARIALKGQVAISATDSAGELVDAAGLQIPGVLDDLYGYDGPLGVTIEEGVPTLRVWAPTARSVRLHLFADSDGNSTAEVTAMRIDPDTGVWSISGTTDWIGNFYLFAVDVYVPSEGSVQTNLVTDPYSYSLALNSMRSQIVDLSDLTLMPAGWLEMTKPELDAAEDIVLYELHIRDFSVNDMSVPEDYRGTFMAFTVEGSNGMNHLASLADSGLTHVHMLPLFDIATIDENKGNWSGLTFADLAPFPADSAEQQARIEAQRDADGFNWGYDPFHYTAPEGSYATDPDGPARIMEFRSMVQALNANGLRLVLDVVYNHTNASGQNANSVLDKIVPGYYHRLNATGRVESSTCCQNTATEHDMMRKLMVDSIVTWATIYKVDGFRFDLMGHHMKADMLAVRAALDALTLAEHGVDGRRIYIYGEGWDFGEVSGNARGINANQANMGGTGIGTFNDRVRDAVRGGSPFGGQTEQGFITGLYTDPNGTEQGDAEAQLARLLLFSDQIRVSLAGNLRDYTFIDAGGAAVNGQEIPYNGNPTAYNEDPQEQIIYISAHDNETLWDVMQFKVPAEMPVAERVRIQNLGISLVSMGQGVPFFHAGAELLRSKSMDRNSYNSGDWFNRLDFTYQNNNWGAGLPPASDNSDAYELIAPLLAQEGIAPGAAEIRAALAHFQEMLKIRQSSPLFRLQTAGEVQERLQFHNTGPDQIPGLIVMSIADAGGADLDPNADMILVLFNAAPEAREFTAATLVGMTMELHPVQQNSADVQLSGAAYDAVSGTFTVPARTTAVFVMPQGEMEIADAAEPEAVIDNAAESVAETAIAVGEAAVIEEHTEEAAEPNLAFPSGPSSPQPWLIWLGAAGIGLLLALLTAGMSGRRDDHH